MKPRLLLDSDLLEITLKRLTQQLIENHGDFSNSVVLGIQPRGIFMAERIRNRIIDITGNKDLVHGDLDVTFFRDDFGRREEILVPSKTNIDFVIEGKKVVLVDDVLFTGRTIRSAMDAMLSFGRPKKVELMVLIDRRYSRHLPIEPDYVGKQVDTIASEKVKVEWKEMGGKADKVWLVKQD
ncbi:bifunctional pyr operon transcriptional regulator/uracil phosphoribosyltransferase PyrR [bacterium AH-315-C07]|nr:bifunctional pyr operon transcriptional regulator/uracil phosphoribosyltransferase PyrR [bacterium AH-315-C07]